MVKNLKIKDERGLKRFTIAMWLHFEKLTLWSQILKFSFWLYMRVTLMHYPETPSTLD